jgi:hypothetical protein
MLRRILERCSRGVVLKRRLPARFGRQAVYVSPDASLRYWRLDLGKIDPELLDLVARLVQPGDRWKRIAGW